MKAGAFSPVFFCHDGTSPKRKPGANRNGCRTETETETATATAAGVGKKRPGLRGRLKMREIRAAGISAERRARQSRGPGGGGGKSGLRRPKRGISTLSGAASRYGGVRALALGLSFGGRGVRRRCCKMRVVAIKRGESRAWGRFFSGLRRKDPDADPPAAQAARRISPSHRRSGGIAFGRIAAGVCLPLPPPPQPRLPPQTVKNGHDQDG